MSSRQALDAKASSMMFILCVFWGLQQVVQKVAAADISPLMQLALRLGLSAVMVCLCYCLQEIHNGLRLNICLQAYWGVFYLPQNFLC